VDYTTEGALLFQLVAVLAGVALFNSRSATLGLTGAAGRVYTNAKLAKMTAGLTNRPSGFSLIASLYLLGIVRVASGVTQTAYAGFTIRSGLITSLRTQQLEG
jgi:hypothetical protein